MWSLHSLQHQSYWMNTLPVASIWNYGHDLATRYRFFKCRFFWCVTGRRLGENPVKRSLHWIRFRNSHFNFLFSRNVLSSTYSSIIHTYLCCIVLGTWNISPPFFSLLTPTPHTLFIDTHLLILAYICRLLLLVRSTIYCCSDNNIVTLINNYTDISYLASSTFI